MITENDLKEAIAECEGQRNPTPSTCLKLAAFYTIQDKLFPNQKEEEKADVSINVNRSQFSRSRGPIETDTEFLQAVSNMSRDDILSVMDELMTTLQILMPKLYDGVMRKLT